jgi:hypothetical protein
METAAERFFKDNGIRFKPQSRLIPGPRHRFDFELTDSRTLRETHGRQHYEPGTTFGGTKEFKATQKRDRFKPAGLATTAIGLLVIKNDQNVADVLTKELGRA